MTTAETLNALADRVEREEPSRPLEGEIFEAVGGQLWELAYARAQEPCGCPEETARIDARLRAPRFLTSLDAAVTLEPKDAQEICVRKYPNGGHYVRITLASGRPVYCDSLELPITEAAARIAAALRARAAMERT